MDSGSPDTVIIRNCKWRRFRQVMYDAITGFAVKMWWGEKHETSILACAPSEAWQWIKNQMRLDSKGQQTYWECLYQKSNQSSPYEHCVAVGADANVSNMARSICSGRSITKLWAVYVNSRPLPMFWSHSKVQIPSSHFSWSWLWCFDMDFTRVISEGNESPAKVTVFAFRHMAMEHLVISADTEGFGACYADMLLVDECVDGPYAWQFLKWCNGGSTCPVATLVRTQPRLSEEEQRKEEKQMGITRLLRYIMSRVSMRHPIDTILNTRPACIAMWWSRGNSRQWATVSKVHITG